MKTIDALVESFEQRAQAVGVDHVDLRGLARHHLVALEQPSNFSDQQLEALTELLRVWMEYRKAAGYLTTAEDALAQFPDTQFPEQAVAILRFEQQRLESSTHSGERGSHSCGQLQLPETPCQWGDFMLLDTLGEGAFARVYLARQTSMADRPVALKLTSRPTQESHWLARLQHSAIVPIYSVHQVDGLRGVCMPYLGNTTLANLLNDLKTGYLPKTSNHRSTLSSALTDQDGESLLVRLRERQRHVDTVLRSQDDTQTRSVAPHEQLNSQDRAGHQPKSTSLPETPIASADNEKGEGKESTATEYSQRSSVSRELARLNYVESIIWITAQLADALSHAHRIGVLHCDIKPANILLAADGQPRLLDFNVAQAFRLSQPLSGPNIEHLGGTPAYMSPEHLQAMRGEPTANIDVRSDIYSLGAVAFELLTGGNYVASERTPQHASAIAALLRSQNTGVSPALAAIVGKCLCANPSDRYQNSEALYEDLIAQLNHRPLIHQPEPSVSERAGKWCLRHPRLTSIGSISLLACALLTFSIATIYKITQSRDAARTQLLVNQIHESLPAAITVATAAVEYPELRAEAIQTSTDLLKTAKPFLQHSPASARRLSANDHHAILALARHIKIHQLDWHEAAEMADINSIVDQTLESLPQENTSTDPWNSFESLYASGRYSEALQAAQLAEPDALNDYAFWIWRGHCNLELGNHQEASECYSVSVSLRPDILLGRFYRGIAKLKQQRYSAAIEDFQPVVNAKPNWMEARYNLALAQQGAGNPLAARQTLDQAIQSGWRSVQGFVMRGQLAQRAGDRQQAASDFAEALKCEPKSPGDWIRLGTLQMRNNPIQAEQLLREGVKRDPRATVGWKNLAHLLSESLGRPEDSVDALQHAINLEPDDASNYAGQGVLLARLGRVNESFQSLQTAAKLNPATPLVMYQIASGYSRLANELEGHTEPSLTEVATAATHWYGRAVAAEPSIQEVANNDPDAQWLRSQPRFNAINAAISQTHASAATPTINTK